SATGGIEYEGVLGEGFAPLSLIMCAGISTGPPAIFTAYVSGAVRREILGMLSWPSTGREVKGGGDGMSVHSAKLPECQLIGIPAPGDEQPGSWPRSMLVEMDDKFTTAVREAFAAGNERATAAAATVVTARGAAGSRRGLGTVTDLLLRRAQAGRAGAQGDDDYDVIDAGGLIIGRIFK